MIKNVAGRGKYYSKWQRDNPIALHEGFIHQVADANIHQLEGASRGQLL
jgi:hypothetical protein